MEYAKLIHLYIFSLLMLIKNIICNIPKLKHTHIFVSIPNFMLFLYYHYWCGLSPCTVDLDDETTMHFWISNHRRYDRPNLVLIQGCGGNAMYQFVLQIGTLSKSFNIYIPDLLFFGKSYTKCKDRTPRYQAKCIGEGLKRGFGVEKCTVYSISYGGWVGYYMAKMYPSLVDKNVIVSSGVGSSADQKMERLSLVGKTAEEVVIPRDPELAKLLIKASLYKYDFSNWAPQFMLWQFVKGIEDKNRKEKEELIRYLMSGEADSNISPLSQETLLVWGDQDNFFPKEIGHQLRRILGPKARLVVLKETGHAVNIDAAEDLNELIKSTTNIAEISY